MLGELFCFYYYQSKCKYEGIEYNFTNYFSSNVIHVIILIKYKSTYWVTYNSSLI